jgi:PEP-CTERM motif
MRQSRMALFSCTCAALFALMYKVGQARSDVIASNLGDTEAGAASIYPAGPPKWNAQEFTTGATSETLTDAIAVLGVGASATTGDVDFAELESDNSNTPSNTVLTTFTVPTIGTAYSDVTLLPLTPVVLAADTNYWLVLGATGTSTSAAFKWQYTDTETADLPNDADTETDGATWSVFSGGPFLSELDGTAVPEPTTLGVLCVGGLGLLSRRRGNRGT